VHTLVLGDILFLSIQPKSIMAILLCSRDGGLGVQDVLRKSDGERVVGGQDETGVTLSPVFNNLGKEMRQEQVDERNIGPMEFSHACDDSYSIHTAMLTGAVQVTVFMMEEK
jgi:hypothetical protein